MKVADKPSSVQLPPKLLDEELLLQSVISHRKVICQCVEFTCKDDVLFFSDQKFSIPIGYPGWFEVLSADGKTISPCHTIGEVAEKNPEKFLVRSKVKAYTANEDGSPSYDEICWIPKGELLKVLGQFRTVHGWRKQKKSVLHCEHSSGAHIYLDFKSTGQFSPVAGLANISGVHSIERLVSQFRLPLTVRIVSGQIPRIASKNDRPGVFRLTEVHKDTTALFLPLKSHQKLLPVSTRTDLVLIPSSNMQDLRKLSYIQQLQNLAMAKADKYFRTMQILVSTKQQNKGYSACTLPSRGKPKGRDTRAFSQTDAVSEEDILFAEVDDLYAYVRRGGVPPKPRPRSWANNAFFQNISMDAEGKSNSQPLLSSNGKPRGLLASLTAGKFPSKATRHQKTMSAVEPQRTSTLLLEKELPTSRREEIIRSYMDEYKGSEESLQTEVDPYVDAGHYQNLEAMEQIKRRPTHTRHRSMDCLLLPPQSSQQIMYPNSLNFRRTSEATPSLLPKIIPVIKNESHSTYTVQISNC